MIKNSFARVGLGAILVLQATAPSMAQETRAERIASEQAARAATLVPAELGGLERIFYFVESSGVPERVMEGLGGFYPRFGGLTAASGFAVGGGYRRHLAGDAVVQTGFTGSLRGYQLADVSLTTPLAGDLLTLGASAAYRDYTQERYFGIGGSAHLEDRTHYGLRGTDLSLGVTLRPLGPLRLVGEVGVLNWEVNEGEGRFPSIGQLFSDADAPGLDGQPWFLTWRGRAEVDFRDVPASARAGGLYSVELTELSDRELARFSFRRYDVQGIQYLPFFDKRRVVVLRARGVFADPRPGHRIPFYVMPTLGGPETLRGFREDRFRDSNMLLLTAEYRWEVFASLEMALFADGGAFAARASDLSLRDLKSSYGVGFRFSTVRKFLFRFDVGRGPEGTRFFARFVPVF